MSGAELPSEHGDAFYDALRDDDEKQLYERAPCGYLSTTPDGVIIKANLTFLDMIGYDRDELVGRRRFADLLTGGGRIYHETHFAPMLRVAGTARAIALELVRSDRSRLAVLVNAALERDADGNPLVVRTAIFDATERRAYEQELRRAKEQAEASEAAAVELARTLQQVLIPPELPAIVGLDLAAAFRPAGSGGAVGGDFYDVFQVGTDDWILVLGDVCGKGPHAAVVSALARHVVRGAAIVDQSPARTLHALNRALLDHPTERFCTAVIVRLQRRPHHWDVTVGAGGHPLPVLRHADGSIRTLGTPGHLLGMFEDARHHEVRAQLHAGDLVVAYTDGVTEARHDRDFFGEQALEQLIASTQGTARSITEAILDTTVAFQGDLTRDDIAIVAVKIDPLPPVVHDRFDTTKGSP